jgi:hypothetical protein
VMVTVVVVVVAVVAQQLHYAAHFGSRVQLACTPQLALRVLHSPTPCF